MVVKIERRLLPQLLLSLLLLLRLPLLWILVLPVIILTMMPVEVVVVMMRLTMMLASIRRVDKILHGLMGKSYLFDYQLLEMLDSAK